MIHWAERIWTPYGYQKSENTMLFYGTEGMVEKGRWEGGRYAFRVYDRKGDLVHQEQEQSPDEGIVPHMRNFIDCIRTREQPNADVEIGHVSAALCHLGNIVVRTGRNLRFDGKTETIVGRPGGGQAAHTRVPRSLVQSAAPRKLTTRRADRLECPRFAGSGFAPRRCLGLRGTEQENSPRICSAHDRFEELPPCRVPSAVLDLLFRSSFPSQRGRRTAIVRTRMIRCTSLPPMRRRRWIWPSTTAIAAVKYRFVCFCRP